MSRESNRGRRLWWSSHIASEYFDSDVCWECIDLAYNSPSRVRTCCDGRLLLPIMLIAAYLIAQDTMVWRMCRLFSLRFRVTAPDATKSSLIRLFMVDDWTSWPA